MVEINVCETDLRTEEYIAIGYSRANETNGEDDGLLGTISRRGQGCI